MFEIEYYHVDADGNMRPLKQDDHGGIVTFERDALNETDGGFRQSGAYTDRLYQWDFKKYNASCREVWNNEAQYWDNRTPADIEKFITAYYGRPCRLTKIVRYVNQSSGFPVWYLGWQWLDADPNKE